MPDVSIRPRRHRWVLAILVVALAIAGAVCWMTSNGTAPIPTGPAVVIVVLTNHPDMPAHEVESTITPRIASAVARAPGAVRVESHSEESFSVVAVYFRDGSDRNSALMATDSLAVAEIPALPPETLPPIVLVLSDASRPAIDELLKKWAAASAMLPTRKLRLLTGKCSLTGIREFNDDVIAITEPADASLCLVGDGMGGIGTDKPLGVIACEHAFEVLTKKMHKNLPDAATPEENQSVIRRAIVAANEEVMAAITRKAEYRSMGTTIVLALWRHEPRVYIAGVGDSRAYLVRGKHIQQLTVDHTLAQALVESKTITLEEAREHRFRNVLWKYLGSKEVGDGPEVSVVPLQVGERILLCTDGLHGVVKDEQIMRCMREHADVQKCADALCQLALDSGSRDNVSCIVIEMAAGK